MIKKLLVLGLILITMGLFGGCGGQDDVGDVGDVGSADSSLIDVIEAEAVNVELVGEMLENSEIGIKVACPSEKWDCDSSEFSIRAFYTGEAHGGDMGEVIMSVMTFDMPLKDVHDLLTVWDHEVLSEKVTEDSYASLIEMDDGSFVTRQLTYVRKLANGNILQCYGDSYYDVLDFETMQATIAKMCMSAENL